MPLFNDVSNLIYPHPGFVSGKYYASAISPTNSSTAFPTGFVYYTYFFVPFQQSFDRVGFISQTSFGSAQFARVSIYKVVSGLPSSLINDLGVISLTSAGFKEVSCSVNLPSGWYAIGVIFTATTACIWTSINLASLIGTASPTASSIASSGLRATLAYGAFPASASLVGITDALGLLIWLRAA